MHRSVWFGLLVVVIVAARERVPDSGAHTFDVVCAVLLVVALVVAIVRRERKR